MSKYLKNYANLNDAKTDDTIVSPNVSLIANSKILHLDTHVKDEELLVIGNTLEKSRLVKKYIADTTSNPELITLARSLGWIDSEAVKMSVRDAMAVTTVNDEDGYSLLSSSGLKSFDEFEYFTGVTTCPIYKGSGDIASLPNSCTSIKLPDSIESVGNYAFYRCSSLTSVMMGDSVTSIGSSAFSHCSGLTSVTIPNSVTSIGEGAFADCSGLTSVTIGNSVTSIGEGAFADCSGLTSVTIPNSVTSIGDYAFYKCTGFTSVTIPDGVTSIGGSAFYGCNGLTSITIPDGVTSIGSATFSGCSSLVFVNIPDSVTSIGKSAFYGCNSLESITCEATTPPTLGAAALDTDNNCPIYVPAASYEDYVNPDSSISKGWYIYESRIVRPHPYNEIWYTANAQVSPHIQDQGYEEFGANITDNTWNSTTKEGVITFDGNVTSIGDFAFKRCSSLTSVTIPNSVTNIGDYAFNECSSLTSVTIPNSVKSIEYDAFESCSSLTIVTIPNSVTSIRDYTFSNCSSLTSVTIGNSVASIGDDVFYECTGLTSITFTGTSTQWYAITRGSDWHQSVQTTTVYCEGDGKTVSLDATS